MTIEEYIEFDKNEEQYAPIMLAAIIELRLFCKNCKPFILETSELIDNFTKYVHCLIEQKSFKNIPAYIISYFNSAEFDKVVAELKNFEDVYFLLKTEMNTYLEDNEALENEVMKYFTDYDQLKTDLGKKKNDIKQITEVLKKTNLVGKGEYFVTGFKQLTTRADILKIKIQDLEKKTKNIKKLN